MNRDERIGREHPDSTDNGAFPILHVHDLPQLYQKPSKDVLLTVLNLLAVTPSSFSNPKKGHEEQPRVLEQGVPGYLTSIISSSLVWIVSEDDRDEIWGSASARLSERSGRNAMPSMTRDFIINDHLTVQLHEPTLVEDQLGFKTWTSSLLMSRRLPELKEYIPSVAGRVLELGAGTGLVGISAACVWKTHVLLTDLPEIVPNLQRNLQHSQELITSSGGTAEARALDWADETAIPANDDDKFEVVLAADPIYSADHPQLLVSTVCRWLRWESATRFVVELPLRDHYSKERQQLRALLHAMHFLLVAEGTEVGYDDWQSRDGSQAEVTCWWSVWRPNIADSQSEQGLVSP